MSLDQDEVYIAKKEVKKLDHVPDDRCLGDVLFENMKKFSNRIAQYVADTDEVDTFGDLLTRCIRTALKLRERGITRNDIVSSCTHNHINSCVPFIATQLIGAKAATFDGNLSHVETVHLLKLVQPKILFVSLDYLPNIENCLKEAMVETELVTFGKTDRYSQFSEFLEPNVSEAAFAPTPIKNCKDTAVILFSSGSTGFPKGICLSHFSLLQQTCNESFCTSRNVDNSKVVTLLFTTLYWISAVSALLQCVRRGDTRLVCLKFDARNTWKLIEKYKVTFIFLPPHLAQDFLMERPESTDISSLEIFSTGSTPVTEKLMEDLKAALPNAIVLQGYGQTEISGLLSIFSATSSEEVAMQNRKPRSCGKIRTGIMWKIVDPDSEKVLGPNQRGEIRIKSDFLMNGYYKMDSSSVFDSEGYFKTGDIGYYDEDECIYLVNRIKEMFKYRGWHILPTILEEVLLRHPAVKEAIVIGVPHEIDGDRPMGIVVLKDTFKDVTARDIELYVEARVSDTQKLRAGVKFVKEIVRTSTGKVRRYIMRNKVINHEI